MAKWTYEAIVNEAKKYSTKGEFVLGSSGAVKAARKLKVYAEVCKHMKRPSDKNSNRSANWTKESLQEEALKYPSKSEFTARAGAAVRNAKLLGVYEEICEHMTTCYRTWTYKELALEAKMYTTRSDFQKNSSSAYVLANTKGILNKICKHMIVKHEDWTLEKVCKIAKLYSRRVDFQRNDVNAYSAAKRLGWLDEACDHIEPVFNTWTNHSLQLEALKYEFRTDFQYESKGAYMAAFKRGLLEEICSHMEYKDGSTQLSNELYMYYIRIDTLNSSLPPVWKIGITKYKDTMRRFKREISVAETKITVLKTWYFDRGYDAASAERNVMETYKEFTYTGDSPLRETKTTEMFNEDILKLEVPNG